MVKLFSKPGCFQCRLTEKKMNELGVEYEKIDVLQDESALNHIKELGYNELPVIEYGQINFSGFRPNELEKLQ